jgi:hypothetical protein
MAGDGSSNLEILITAVDEASAAFEEINESMGEMAAAAEAASTNTNESLDSVGATAQATSGELSAAMQAQNESFALAAEIATQSDQEIIDTMLEFGVNAQTAANIVVQSNEEIAESSAETATLTKGSFMSIGVVAGLAFAAVASAVSSAISAAQAWDEESAIIAQTLKDTGAALPLSDIQAYAQQIQANTLLTQQQALQSEGLILSYKDLQPNYQSLTMLSADLATKMSQVSGTMTDNLPNATKILVNALEDPVAGINQLIRQGTVAFPAATVTMIENMAKVGDTAGADALILDTLNGKVGGMAQAAAQAPGAGLTQLSNSLSALGTQVGNDLLPDLDALAKALLPIITNITNWVGEHPKLTEAILAGIVVFTGLLAVLTLVGLIVAAVGSAFAAFALGIAAVVALLVGEVVANWNLIKTDTEEAWNFIGNLLVASWNANKTIFHEGLTEIQTLWNTVWQAMANVLGTIWQTIENTVKAGVNSVISAINAFINALDSLHISIPSISIPGTKLATPAVNLGFSIPDIPMLAAGGFVTQPTLALIGESGPEAVIPLSAGGGFGGGSVVNVYIQGGIFPADASTIKRIGDMLAKQVTVSLRTRNYAT